jgi:hypothetical protein
LFLVFIVVRKKPRSKGVRKKILTAQDPGREAFETRMRELRALADANMKAQVQAWQTGLRREA